MTAPRHTEGATEAEREAFEAWIRTCEGHPFAGQFANLMWSAWQARAPLSGWISVDVRLPSHEQEVICTGFEGNDPAKTRWQQFATFHECGLFYDTEHGEQFYPPTHWMPTPPAPNQGAES